MKRATYDHYPATVEAVGDGSNFYRWDIKEEIVERLGGESRINYTCREVAVYEPVNFAKLVSAMIRDEYSADDELAMARQSYSGVEEYKAYNTYVEDCKKNASEMLGLAYHPTYAPTQAEVMTQVRTLLKGTVDELPDDKAAEVPALFDPWSPGDDVAKGTKRCDSVDGKLYKCVQPHKTQVGWEPHNTPALWTPVSLDEWPEIPETIPAENPWMSGQKGTWKGERYICKMDNCVWTPDQYPQAWERV